MSQRLAYDETTRDANAANAATTATTATTDRLSK
jgi:hypothetical protein